MVAKILNQSDGKWVFENLAQMLSRSLWVDISEDVADLNYVLGTDTDLTDNRLNSFQTSQLLGYLIQTVPDITTEKPQIEKRSKLLQQP
jgi:hypothetical protein